MFEIFYGKAQLQSSTAPDASHAHILWVLLISLYFEYFDFLHEKQHYLYFIDIYNGKQEVRTFLKPHQNTSLDLSLLDKNKSSSITIPIPVGKGNPSKPPNFISDISKDKDKSIRPR